MVVRFLRAVREQLGLGELLAVGGLASIFHGLQLWSPPAAFVVLGTLLLAGAVVGWLRGGA